MKEIFYWGPFIDDKIATVKAIQNSVIGINKYSKIYKATIINSIGEWNKIINNKNKEVFLNSHLNLYEKLPKYNFIKSRFSYLIVSLICFFQLKKILLVKKPDIFIAHLLISVPLLLFKIFKFKSKLIIRISGKPKLNYLRKKIWQLSSKNVYKVLCPTEDTKNLLISENIFTKDKIFVLRDPVIYLEKFRKYKFENYNIENFQKNNIILVGRLTKQKNFELIIKAIEKNEIIKQEYKVYIFGSGEEKDQLENSIKKKKLTNIIFLMGHEKNIIKYMKKSEIFILTSLWEDPGFVLIEAGMCNLSIIASDCPSGPKEIISPEEYGGLLFENNDEISLNKKINQYFNTNKEQILKKKIYFKKNIRKFTVFNHTKNLEKILEINKEN
jgi:glycosyltransferase involved in cell wall biosynthesis